MTVDEILTAARDRAGVADPDSNSWREGLEILIRDHEKTKSLSERGAGMIKARYVESLAARMQVDRLHA